MNKFKSLLLIVFLSLVGTSSMARVADVQAFVRHEVADYAAWKKVYDAFASEQKKGGVFAQVVYQAVDNPNDVTVIHSFHSLEKAKAFTSSPELKADMIKAGVKGTPQIWLTQNGKK